MKSEDVKYVKFSVVPEHEDSQAGLHKINMILGYSLLALGFIASAGGVSLDSLYRDIPKYVAAWQSNDLVTLMVIVPLMVYALAGFARHKLPSALLLLGLELYLLYNYAYYLFGSEFNNFFLIYLLIFTISIYALILGTMSLDIKALPQVIPGKVYSRWISGFLILISLPLLIVEGSQAIGFWFTGQKPEFPSLIIALDLSLVVPASIIAGILLWKRNIWGFLLSTLMCIKAFTYGLVLVTMTIYAGWVLGMDKDPLLPFYISVCLGGLVSSIYLLKSVRGNFP